MPFVVGDIYGAPNAGELVPVDAQAGHEFLAESQRDAAANLAKSLIPTAFSQNWMAIEPAAARIARLSPFVLPADGIVPVGMTEWLDADTGTKLMLIYVDRPARVRGDIVYEGRSLRFDIEAKEAGYLWIQQPEGSGDFQGGAAPGEGSPCGNAQLVGWGSLPTFPNPTVRGIFRGADPSITREREPCNDIFSWQPRVLPRPPFFLAPAPRKSPHRRRPSPKKPSRPSPDGRRPRQVPDPAAGHRDLHRGPVGARVQRQDLRLPLARLRFGHSER